MDHAAGRTAAEEAELSYPDYAEAPAEQALPGPIQREADLDGVPVIDFAGMLNGDADEKRRVASAFRHACTQVGFFYLANHGVPQHVVESAFAETHRFFGLPLETKMRWHLTLSTYSCGYVPLHGENGDLHEAFDVAAEDTQIGSNVFAGDFRQEGNLWPDDLPGFRETVTRYSDSLRLLTKQLFGAFALALELPEAYFAPMTDKPISLLRLLHYPSQNNPLDEGYVGVRAHTDHECFTILCQDDVTGLQVRNRRGEWMDVPRKANTFVVNIGDQMARWSNDRFVSSLHRVVNTSGRERYSIPFFVGANSDVVIEALPSCISADNPAKYPPIVAGDYVLQLIQQGYQTPAELTPAP